MGKLFIGGISWDTNEVRLREYFENFGEVVEAVIMKDRTTGRARGFGFVVFADPAVAEKVVMEKHLIDGRMVEAKKAVPRDDRYILNRNSNGIQGSPGPGRMKKIFVGGLASTVTDADFRKYFEQFGTINDVVVMYDHNTQRPRGFGFITFDSEDAVDKVLHKTFHELNGKMVEVKIAVPKELSPGPSMRLPIGGSNYRLNRMNSFLNGYNQEYNPNSIGSYNMRMDGRYGPLAGGRKGFSPFSPDYGIRLNFEPGMSPTYSGSSNFNSGLGYERALSPYYSGNSNRFGNPIGYSGGISNPGSALGLAAPNLLGPIDLTNGTNPIGSNSFMTSGIGSLSGFGNSGLNWADSSSPLSLNGMNSGGLSGWNPNHGSGENSFGLLPGSYGRNNGTGPVNTSLATTANGYQQNYTDAYGGGLTYGGGSIYGDSTWLSVLSDLDGSSPFGYELGTATSEVAYNGGSPGYIGGYTASNRQMNRGIVT